MGERTGLLMDCLTINQGLKVSEQERMRHYGWIICLMSKFDGQSDISGS